MKRTAISPGQPIGQAARAAQPHPCEILERAWNFARGHFVDRFGGEQLDASLLLLPLVNFIPSGRSTHER